MGESGELSNSHIPAFGSWDRNNHLAFTQRFETARHAKFLHHAKPTDLYEDGAVTPVNLVAPHRKGRGGGHDIGGGEKEKKKENTPCKCRCELIEENDDEDEESSESTDSPSPSPRRQRRAVDEDLYKIAPEDIRAYTSSKRKTGMSFLSFRLSRTCGMTLVKLMALSKYLGKRSCFR